jgi:hypothetical protein
MFFNAVVPVLGWHDFCSGPEQPRKIQTPEYARRLWFGLLALLYFPAYFAEEIRVLYRKRLSLHEQSTTSFEGSGKLSFTLAYVAQSGTCRLSIYRVSFN